MKMYQREIAAIFEATFRLIKDQLKKKMTTGESTFQTGIQERETVQFKTC